MKDYKEKYIKCDCCSECSVIKITESPLYNKDKKIDYMIHLCIYTFKKNKSPISHKLKVIWNVIRYGEPYDDEIVISRKDSIELSKYLGDIENGYKKCKNK